MNWFNKIERKIGRFAIPNLMYYILGLYGVGVLIVFWMPQIYYDYLGLDIYKILHGEVWRLITFLVYPPLSGLNGEPNIFMTMLSMYIYFMFGTILEREWGSFRFNIYFFGGVIWTVIATAIVYFVRIAQYNVVYEEGYSLLLSILVNTQYINFSLFIGYAFSFPEHQMLLFFVLPVKAKILAGIEILVYAVLYVKAFIEDDLGTIIMISAAVINIFLFWLITKKAPSKAQKKRRKEFEQKIKNTRSVNRHLCAICGKTSETAPDETFRYCSKCEGNFEYCSEHLYTHVHITKEPSDNVVSLNKIK